MGKDMEIQCLFHVFDFACKVWNVENDRFQLVINNKSLLEIKWSDLQQGLSLSI